MASKPGAWYAFPWETWGTGKYVVLLPFVAAVALGADDVDSWAWHMLALAALRYAHAAAWNTLSRLHAVSAATRITAKPVEFKQVDREDNWDDYILLQTLVMTLVHNTPHLGFGGFPGWNGRGLVQLALLHAGPTEWLYYWLHRALHWHPLYQRYHSHHHASFVAEPITGACVRAVRARRGDGHTAAPGNNRRPGLFLPGLWLRSTPRAGGAPRPDRARAAPPPPPRRAWAAVTPRRRAALARTAAHAAAAATPRARVRATTALSAFSRCRACTFSASSPPRLTAPPPGAPPCPGSVHPFAEHLMYTANFAIPLLGTWAAGGASWSMFYIYLLGFDLLNAIGHCNFEFVPTALFKARRRGERQACWARRAAGACRQPPQNRDAAGSYARAARYPGADAARILAPPPPHRRFRR
jgi:hypothetical protein